tara:strand:+ start:111 stop:956 length:846 start_codon:yes stop_codon:yes gene_type:complete
MLNSISIETQIITSTLLIMLVGIPHGSLDHLLLPTQNFKSRLRFYIFYLGLIILNLLVWNYSQISGLVLFFFISSYHFGESQLYKFNLKNKLVTHFIYMCWGVSVIFSFLFYNIDELQLLSNSYEDTRNLISNLNLDSFSYLFLASNIITLILFTFCIYKFKVKANKVISEVFFLFVIHLSSFLFPLLICFTLFFIILHSLPSLVNQYNHFKKANNRFTLKDFIYLMTPYSLVSIIFLLFISFCSYTNVINYSVPLISIILISVITLPHSFIISKFNQSLN